MSAGDPDPYPNLAWLRSTMPIAEVPGAGGTAWFVTSYEHARTLLADPRLSNDARHATDGVPPEQPDLLSTDAPAHTRLRKAVSAAFTPRAVQRMRPAIADICRTAIDAFAARGTADLMADYALPVPVAVIHTLLGVPADEQEDPAHVMDLFYRAGFAEEPGGPALAEVDDYVRRIVEYKRAHPGDDLTTGLLGCLDRGELVDEAELHGMIYVLLGAGHTTTVPFLGAAVLRLLCRPGEAAAMLDDADRLRAVVDEALRHDSAVQASVNRYALDRIDIGDVVIGKGDRLVISLAAANRDPARFAEPEEFAPAAARPSHLAFGHGIHVCLGVHLARLEGEIALEALFRRIPSVRLAIAEDDVAWALGPMLRGPRELPVTFDRGQ
jgi:cytochrome P450